MTHAPSLPLLLIVVHLSAALCPPKLCLPRERCHVREVSGAWCDWSPWAACDLSSCSRSRGRVCGCPRPSGFKAELLCEAQRYQNDIVDDRAVIKHTRLIRKSSVRGVNCEIPFYINDEYHPDCIQKGTEHICKVKGGKFETCMMNQTDDMMEEDIGYCDGWLNYPNWSLTSSRNIPKSVFSSETDLGQKCNKRSPFDTLTGCRLYLYFGKNQRSDFGRLVDLAYDITACRLACSLHPECHSIDFFEGFRCSLNMIGDSMGLEQQVGNKHETKPQVCIREQRTVNKDNYGFSNVVRILDVNRYGG